MEQNPEIQGVSPAAYGRIKAIALDIDGVMTQGELIPLANGDLLRIMDAKDSFAVRVAAQKGYIVAFISGGKTEALTRRCLHLGCREENLYLGTRGKLAAFRDFCSRNSLDPSEIMYFGDDVPDTQVLKAAGIGIAPSDAAPDAREAADIVSGFPGGKGCVRHEIEKMMRLTGKWHFDPDKYDQIF